MLMRQTLSMCFAVSLLGNLSCEIDWTTIQVKIGSPVFNSHAIFLPNHFVLALGPVITWNQKHASWQE